MKAVVHNCIVHPLLGLAQLLADVGRGAEAVLGWLHDRTAP